ncbi:MAG: hypothetical protein FP820_05910 [Sulfurimonas sp.]|nr:hypothetical protein [Sulfurimonas sp.]MBU3938545.1 hypothetical protein [bacterium]MBU4024612.1 hypothetical protein [bacterium]MBU4059619.1 hypothetical protein [bacterium]MBU4110056.1 hypothetical protein [bacterium]
MKFLLLALLFSVTLCADFYIVNGSQKVKMTPLSTGAIDFSTFKDIAKIQRNNSELHAYGEEVAFNHRHLNFRLATISLNQENYTMTEWSKKAENKSDEYHINFADYTRDDGVMLQLFYKNNWYAVVLGEPLKILHNLFNKIDINSKELDVENAIKAVKQAREAFPLDDELKRVEMELKNRYANDLKTKKEYKQERIEFPKKP